MVKFKPMILESIQKLVQNALNTTESIPLEIPSDKSHGDFSTSIALKLAKQVGKSPRELAQEIIDNLPESDLVEKTEMAGPGFINFYLTKKALEQVLATDFGRSQTMSGKKILVEFAHPNTHKAFHIGHLRNISLGESIVRIFESRGAEIFRANYQGDIGLHVAKCLWGYMRTDEPSSLNTPQEKAEFLGKVYAKGGVAFEKDEQAKKEIYEINKKLYARDPELVPLWKKTREWSLEYFDYIYKRLGSKFDRLFFESEVYESGKKIVLEYLNKGVFEESDGAVIFPGEKHGLHNRVFITSDGNATYEAKEMGLAELERTACEFDQAIHVVANEQDDYFKVVFKAMGMIYPGLFEKESQLSYGMVKLTTGKMSSRTGDVVTAEFLIDEAKEEIAKIMGETDLSSGEKAEIMEKVAIGGIKFAMLFSGAKNDIAFDMEKAVRLEGDSGPYLQYAYARINSILEKTSISGEPDFKKFNDRDWSLASELNGFEIAVERAAKELSPHYIAHYLLGLASEFSGWYGENSVKDSEDGLREARLELLKAVARVIKEGLNLMGIEVLERM